MKAKLLKQLRAFGRDQINILSITTTNGIINGMSIGFDDDMYKGLFELGDTEIDVKNKASRIYIKSNIERIRIKYKKYSRKTKTIKV